MANKATNVAVLMAVKNGLAYLPEQIDSIFQQQDCHVTLFVSDDASTDGSLAYLTQLAQQNTAIKLLPSDKTFGSAAGNFYRLICEVDCVGFDYIALADQDDIWLPDKLSRHAQLAKEHQADGISSNVIAFWPDGQERLLAKAQPQRELDYIFQSGGPGCTILMSPRLMGKVKAQLLDDNSVAKQANFHDWLIYAICRIHNYLWIIDAMPSIKYRQHQSNVFGANIGIGANWSRLLWFKRSQYRDNVLNIATLSHQLTPTPKIRQLLDLLEHKSLFNQLKLLHFVPQARRKGLDRLMLAGAILLGVF